MAYEKKFGKELLRHWPSVHSGWWIQYRDAIGSLRWRQPDHFVVETARVLLFECKLTETPRAWEQLEEYSALLGKILPLPIVRVQVCKHLSLSRDPVRDIHLVKDGCVLHWLPL